MTDSKAHILIIDDDDTISLLQAKLLEKAGYSVDHAATGSEGIECLKREKADIVLLDLMLPDTDGLTILKSLPQLRLEKEPDIVVLSALDDPKTTFECLRAGAHDFIRKPFFHEEYLLRINNLMQLRNFRSMTKLLQTKMEGDLKRLSRYFSKDLIQSILSGEVSADSGGQIVRCSCMMFDLRGSTALAEEMGPSKFFKFITELFSDLSDLIFSNGGSISKFTGDGFLVTFGLRNYTEKATLDAINCAFKIRDHIGLVNQLSNPDIKSGIRFGIGITTGDVFAGSIGNVHRLEYTILGDPVNLSARLEALTKKAQVDILIDGPTRALIDNRVHFRKLKLSAVRGKKETVDIYYPSAYAAGAGG